jgi:hypothetical protein
MPSFILLALLTLVSGWVAGMTRPEGSQPSLSGEAGMRAATVAWLDSLQPAQQKQAVFGMDHAERRAWSNLPKTMFDRYGIAFGEMSDKQRASAHRLLRSVLSSQGYLSVTGIMRADDVLHDLVAQSNATAAERYSYDYYWLGVFGDPRGEGAWGLQLDGHHLALNITAIKGKIRVTPTFLGANPVENPSGKYAGTRLLGGMDTLGQELLASLNAKQRKQAIIADKSPGDVLAGPTKANLIGKRQGVSSNDFSGEQYALLADLVDEYFGTFRGDVYDAAVADFRLDLAEGIHFSWLGGGTDKPYAYRLHGKRNWIEFSNVAGPGSEKLGMNHIHSIWRRIGDDYGDAMLQAAK